MFCPRCGKDSFSETKFCRSCGFELESISHMLEMPASAVAEKKRTAEANQLKRIGSIVVIITIELCLFALCIGIVTAMMAGKFPALFGAFVFIVLVGLAVSFALLAIASLKRDMANLRGYPQPPELTEATTKVLPTAELSSAVSVTERTTALLAPKATVNRNEEV
jgi:flagellar basal body-associated protein FliL